MVVAARVRPLLDEDTAAGFPRAVFPRSDGTGVVNIHDLYNHPKGRPILKSFNYEVDSLFDSKATTEEIYEKHVADLVPFAWKGGTATLFAYGQTGSGKTFTVSRLEQLVIEALTDGSLEGQREISFTIFELAGNLAYDLLNSRESISIMEDSFGTTQLVGAQEHLVQDRAEVMDLIERASSFRRTAPTLRNGASSRSHAICRIRIKDAAQGSEGLLYLIDLAGSEAARDVTQHGADRMRETRDINMSLSVLKDCIRGKVLADALKTTGGPKSRQKKPHIPFRQSALTKVMKHVFDPTSDQPSKTVVIACVSPCLGDVGPSKNTLRYAEMLRVVIPREENASAAAAERPPPAAKAPVRKPMGFGYGRASSRDLGPVDPEVPFKERIRPGMVVSWIPTPELRSVHGLPEGESQLAVILCPIAAVPATVKVVAGNAVNTEEGGKRANASYLCAQVTQPKAGTYELAMWRHVVVDVDMIEKAVILEYDKGTRYYYLVA
ncbi:kinesin motor domain-containing protein [Coniochaeta sp. 2T2.1]|nr:kinesin motor domain-containing protein [Coniochaeta sp. 2T2.1]